MINGQQTRHPSCGPLLIPKFSCYMLGIRYIHIFVVSESSHLRFFNIKLYISTNFVSVVARLERSSSKTAVRIRLKSASTYFSWKRCYMSNTTQLCSCGWCHYTCIHFNECLNVDFIDSTLITYTRLHFLITTIKQ